ncbi:MAG: methylated-DNA--[protein]-cysteine S-methyltransferase [Myxococcota bacterium]
MPSAQTTKYAIFPSPIGRLLVAGTADGLCELQMMDSDKGHKPRLDWVLDAEHFTAVRIQLEEYFAGQRRRFDLGLAPVGTPFQTLVWKSLLEIPYGQTTSYGELARRIGRPRAVRAVGAANGRNPISLIVPCHRVIGADGGLTGFGGGLERKRYLLELESGPCRVQRSFDELLSV